MTLLFDIAPFVPPVPPDVTGREIYERFEREPDTLAIAVVDQDERPIGLVERNTFLVQMAARYGYALWARRPISHLMMTDPVIVDGDVTLEEFCRQGLGARPSELLHGLIVTCGGRYAGVGSMLALLQASAAQTAAAVAEAQQALSARGRFLAVMSHEIRTPLNGVLAVAEVARRKTQDPDLAPLLETIVNSGDVLLRLLNDALDLSRAEQSSLQLDENPLSPQALAEDITSLWAPQAELAGVRLDVRYEGAADLWVLGDEVRLRQILNNLLGNAIKFAGGEVTVRIRARSEDPCAILTGEVADDGPGVPPDLLETVFLPFQQTDEGLRRGGAGLGLAVCRQIAERMNGKIRASNRPAGGACFSFELPLYRVPAPADEVSDATRDIAEPGLKVLIVDDNRTNRLVARSLLDLFACESHEACDGAEAVAAVKRRDFDLILMDINMPGMNGIEATRRIRALPGIAGRTPVIALTANADPADAQLYCASGMSAVVEKPIKPERLIEAMNSALEDASPQAAAVA